MHCTKEDTIAVGVLNKNTNQNKEMNLNKLDALRIISRDNHVIHLIVAVLRLGPI